MPILGITASAQQASKLSSFYSIATVTASGGEGLLTFSSIPSTYTHLQIRGITGDTLNNPQSYHLTFTFNSDSTNSYAYHYMRGNGSTVTSAGTSNSPYGYIGGAALFLNSTTTYAASITDIFDYANTSKYKTVRALGGGNNNASSTSYWLELSSSLWMSTSAINTIKIYATGGSFIAGTTFALYGVK